MITGLEYSVSAHASRLASSYTILVVLYQYLLEVVS